MGFAPGSPGRVTCRNSATGDGNAWLRQREDCRGTAEAEAELLSGEPSLQQLVVHIESGAAPRVGVPSALGEQTHRCSRSGSAGSRTDESVERARLADMARLSVTHAEVAAVTVYDQAIIEPCRNRIRR